MCCLKYEQEAYEEKLSRLPRIGAIVKTADGEGEVCQVETLKERVKVKFKDKDEVFFKRYDLPEIEIIKNVEKDEEETDEDIEELKELQKLENLDKIDSTNSDEI